MGNNSNRRDFLRKLAIGTVAGSAFAACHRRDSGPETKVNKVGGQQYQWKMVTTWPKNFPGLGTGANFLAKTIETLSQGQIRIRVYGAGELVPALGVFDAVSRGTAELGHSAAYYWKGKSEAAQFFAAVPFGLNAQELNAWYYYGDGQKLWDELYSNFNLKPFPVGNTGSQMGGWYRKPINTLNDFKGLKIRMPGLGGEVLRNVGATVVTLPGGEIFQALQSKTIDATEWIAPYHDLAFGFHKAAKLYYWPGWHEPGTGIECFVNKKLYDSLPKHLQETVAHACEAANVSMLSEIQARNGAALTTLTTRHGVQLKRFSKPILERLRTISTGVVNEIASKDSFSKKVHANFMKFRKDAIGWGKISEEAYSLARS